MHTLLGLTSNPARLADGTPLDADLARMIAEDAQWQALLTELVTVHDEEGTTPDSTTADPTDNEPTDEDSTGAGERNSDGTADDASGRPRTGGDPPIRTTKPLWMTAVYERLIGRGRVRRGGIVPRVLTQAFTLTRPHITEQIRAHITAELLAAIEDNPAVAAGIFPDGHGGHTSPPPGALTYRPSAVVDARVRTLYRTCTFEHCDVPSTRCELDHIVPLDHTHPLRGGWTIETNLQPVCTGHHRIKTTRSWAVAMLEGCAILWTSRTGVRRISLPDPGVPTLPKCRRRIKRTMEPELPPDPITPTWWEKNQPAGAEPPTKNDLRHAATDTVRNRIRHLRRRFREHKVVEKLRERATPPPF